MVRISDLRHAHHPWSCCTGWRNPKFLLFVSEYQNRIFKKISRAPKDSIFQYTRRKVEQLLGGILFFCVCTVFSQCVYTINDGATFTCFLFINRITVYIFPTHARSALYWNLSPEPWQPTFNCVRPLPLRSTWGTIMTKRVQWNRVLSTAWWGGGWCVY